MLVEQWTEELGLSEAQQAQLQAALDAHREAMDALHEECAGNADRDACREKAQQLREELRTTLAGILTAEQTARLAEIRSERRAEMEERHDANVEQRTERHIGFLVSVLNLDEAQQQQLRAVLDSAREQHDRIREDLRNDQIDPEEAAARMEEIRNQTQASIREILTPDQQVLFDGLAELCPGPGAGFGHGHGKGMGMRGGGPGF
jgi:Spy/CpxP family protein refolding chaperone